MKCIAISWVIFYDLVFFEHFYLQQDKGHPLPKFGEWDVNNPASADGFTVIFNKARDEKKTTATAGNIVSPQRDDNHVYKQNESYHQQHPPKVWTILLWPLKSLPEKSMFQGLVTLVCSLLKIQKRWFCCGCWFQRKGENCFKRWVAGVGSFLCWSKWLYQVINYYDLGHFHFLIGLLFKKPRLFLVLFLYWEWKRGK